MTTNYKRTKEWLDLAFDNLKTLISNYKISEYSTCVYKIQLSIEQLQKALLYLFGLQFRKTHEPSKILRSLINNKNTQIEKEDIKRIKNIVNLAEIIESEGAATRYGIIRDEKLISPKELYNKVKTDEFLKNLKDILSILIELLKEKPDLEPELTILSEFITKIEELEK